MHCSEWGNPIFRYVFETIDGFTEKTPEPISNSSAFQMDFYSRFSLALPMINIQQSGQCYHLQSISNVLISILFAIENQLPIPTAAQEQTNQTKQH